MAPIKNVKGKGKQVSLFTMPGFRKNLPIDESLEEIGIDVELQEHTKEIADAMNMANKAKQKFQEDWAKRFKWIEEDLEAGLLWCSICKTDPNCKSSFGKTGSRNFKTSALEDHAKCKAHRDAIKLQERDKDSLQKCDNKRKESVDVAVEKLFKCAYYIAKEDLAFLKLSSLLRLLRECGVQGLPLMYNDNKACASFVFHISKAIEVETYDKVRKSPWFGLMVDKATDVSVTKNLILYVTFLEGRQIKTSYLEMLVVEDGTANTITECILKLLKQWDLDITKMMGFGSDGASVMAGTSTGVATRLKSHNPFMTSLHCCAHRTNLCVQEASKKPETKATCKMLDEIVNRVTAYFSRSSLRQGELAKMQDELEYTHLHMLGIVKTRWLSRHGAIARICEAYEPLMKTLHSQSDGYQIFVSLRSFKVVYLLHFLADILKVTSSLSLEFQKEFVDVTTIAGLANNAIGEIEEKFLHHVIIDLNGFERDSKNYPIVPDYGGEKGKLAELRGVVKGNMYRCIIMDRDIDGEDLTDAIRFQTLFAKALIIT